jgi:hypothetical protein
VLSRILLMRPHTPDDLRRTLAALETTVRAHSAALVVVDSIAAIARLTYQGTKVGGVRTCTHGWGPVRHNNVQMRISQSQPVSNVVRGLLMGIGYQQLT